MPLLHASLPKTFTVSIFGAQYHGTELSVTKALLIDPFDKLLSPHATHVDRVVHDDTERSLGLTRVWISYWTSPSDFQDWFHCTDVETFWSTLPSDAGFWRETLHFSHDRFLNEVTQEQPCGVGHLGPLGPLTEKSGYWGAYRDRIKEATKEDPLRSTLVEPPVPRQPTGTLRLGRARMIQFPDNLCYVIEGQDHSPMNEEETRMWSAKFHYMTKRWITNVVRAGHEKGMLVSRLCHAPESGQTHVQPSELEDDSDIFPALEINRKIEIFYFQELRHMEAVGRRDKTHVKLRQDFMEAYGPDGPMSHGDLLLWVELGILKGKDLEVEYIGCYDTTGFLAYDSCDGFASVTDGIL
ncbi:hypothetical protein CKM354_000134100 [Cercospora kikuchii]|uniref:Phenylacetaldoxime dehydratase n=1 Tax=Cercospora kikuchii TaxID=84275 RepID=A0A9P3CAR0_9PEZI|nr:uncharacterized protein CKM354_000134100 [Cercospora kikuchii]GIZ37912.1 hypothetical protein CKM354_000134100 [Cercospora kikuchii]